MNKTTAVKYVVVPAATYAAFKIYDRIAIKRSNKNLKPQETLQDINAKYEVKNVTTFVK